MPEKQPTNKQESQPKKEEDLERIIHSVLKRIAGEGTARRSPRSGRTDAPTSNRVIMPSTFEVGAARARHQMENEAMRKAQGDTDRQSSTRQENLNALVGIASNIARSAKDKGIKPENPIHHSVTSYKENRFKSINHVERPRIITDKVTEEYADGWVLARKATILNKRSMVQEAMLGQDGKLHVYIRDDLSGVPHMFSSTYFSRREIQRDPEQTIGSAWGARIADDKDGSQHYLTVEDGKEYPFFGLPDDYTSGSGSLPVEAIQLGLEQFVAENNLSFTSATETTS